jgi:LytS/YehU family sensor histidine kinase
MTFQPFVENAIWHGFVHKKEKGLLLLNITNTGHDLEVEIMDNGVGRLMSKIIVQQHPRKRSFGIAITKQRLKMQNTVDSVEIIDLYDEDQNPKGTKVLLRIPKKYIESSKSNLR